MLARATLPPNRLRVSEYGQSWAGRKLIATTLVRPLPGVPLVQGRTMFAPLKLDRGVNAAYFLGPDQLLASGYRWEENQSQLAYKPLVMVQRQCQGHVIGFRFDPNFRAHLNGLNVLFVNAGSRGPAHEGLKHTQIAVIRP